MNCSRVMALALLACSATLFAGNAIAQARARTAVPAEAARPVTEPAEMAAWLKRLVGRYGVDGLIQVVYYHEGEDYDEHRCAPLPPRPGEDLPPAFVPYCSAIHGKGDCVGIGKGPGVQCVLGVSWQDFYEVVPPPDNLDDPPGGMFQLPGGVSNLSPAVALFGLDPVAAGLKYLVVDQKGLPEGGQGSIKGDTATFRTNCVNGAELLAGMKPPPPPEFPDPPRPEGPPRTCGRIFRIDAKPDANVLHWSMDIEINDVLWTRMEMTLRRDAAVAAGSAPQKP